MLNKFNGAKETVIIRMLFSHIIILAYNMFAPLTSQLFTPLS